MQHTPKYQTETISLPFNGKMLLFSKPSNPDEILDSISDDQAPKDQYQPYWIEHWPSSEVFLSFLARQHFPRRLKILEIGCGLGTLSIALLSLGHQVFSMDISPDSCSYCAHNIRLNQLKPCVICADLNALPFRTKFDLIIASDVLYEERMIENVVQVFLQMAASENVLWLADPCRRYWGTFKNKAGHFFRTKVIHSGKTNKDKTDVEILELKMKKPGLM